MQQSRVIVGETLFRIGDMMGGYRYFSVCESRRKNLKGSVRFRIKIRLRLSCANGISQMHDLLLWTNEISPNRRYIPFRGYNMHLMAGFPLQSTSHVDVMRVLSRYPLFRKMTFLPKKDPSLVVLVRRLDICWRQCLRFGRRFIYHCFVTLVVGHHHSRFISNPFVLPPRNTSRGVRLTLR